MHEDITRPRSPDRPYRPDPVQYLQQAYDRTVAATADPVDCQGTTTAAGAQLFYRGHDDAKSGGGPGGRSSTSTATPLLYVTNLGDSQIMVVRPRPIGANREPQVVYKSREQWHWFDCPRQLGTNSPDTPTADAVMDVVDLEEGDIVLAMSDGVIDNLWGHEIAETVARAVGLWEKGHDGSGVGAGPYNDRQGGANGGMTFVAQEVVSAAKHIALDPFAESPFMEHAIEEGLASEGGMF